MASKKRKIIIADLKKDIKIDMLLLKEIQEIRSIIG